MSQAAHTEPHPAAKVPRRRHNRLRNHGLSIVLFSVFVVTLLGQTWAGWRVYNENQREHGQPAVPLRAYLCKGHYWEALSENWESEFLQMAMFVLLTCFLYQKGSTASKDPDGDQPEEVDADPQDHRGDPSAPWPVRRGGWVLRVYEHSLTAALLLLFVIAFMIHAAAGQREANEQRVQHGDRPISLLQFVGGADFWFQSLQNWQSEFLSIGMMVVLSIFLRQRGSAESKPVHTPHWKTQ